MAKKKRLSSPVHVVREKAKRLNTRRRDFLSRRPHRSFRITQRRDYKRSLKLPGYWSFTHEVAQLINARKWLFIKFIVFYSAMTGLVIGIMSQESYQLLNETIQNLGTTLFNGQVGGLGQNLAIFTGVLAGTFNGSLTEAQQVYGGLLFILGWLTAVWLLRQILAGTKSLRLRDGLYSSGSPLISTFLVLMVLFVQIIPFALAVMGYVAAESVNIFDDTLFTTLFWVVELILMTLSLYWITSSLLALVIVTLPGMYPIKALKLASDLVTSRRVRILYRLGWLVFTLLLVWLIVLLPTITIDHFISIEWLPLVPLAVLFVGSFSLVWSASYIYLLYRKLVDDGAKPA